MILSTLLDSPSRQAQTRRRTPTRANPFRRAFIERFPVYVVLFVFLLVTAAADSLLPPWGPFPHFMTMMVWAVAGTVVGLVYFMRWGARALAAKRRNNPAPAPRWRDFAARALTGGATVGLLLLSMQAFTRWKTAIPSLRPFAWDERLMHLDYVLHFGHHPWAVLHRAFPDPWALIALDRLYYYGWLGLIVVVVVWQSWSRDRLPRVRFFLTWALMWALLGNVAAVLLSSVGPTYFGAVVGQPNPYQGLLDYLFQVHRETPLFVVAARESLWQAYIAGGIRTGSGISAMPSLHVAVVTLFVLRARHTHPLLACFFAAFALLILIGSVYLGWHYAVDGYVSIVSVCLIWWATGRFLRWYGVRTGAFR